jgi:hypothetical protein
MRYLLSAMTQLCDTSAQSLHFGQRLNRARLWYNTQHMGNLLLSNDKLGWNISLKTLFLHFHQDNFQKTAGY